MPYFGFERHCIENVIHCLKYFRYEGYCVDMMEIIAENVSFTYILKIVADGKFGSEHNESWNGMIGEVIRGVNQFVEHSLVITIKLLSDILLVFLYSALVYIKYLNFRLLSLFFHHVY